MSIILDKIRLSMSDDSDLVVVTAKQGDNLSSILPIELYNDQEMVNLSGYTVTFNCVKSDKSVVLYNSMDNDNLIVNGNTINLTLTSAILAVKGTCECEISLYQDDKIWSTYDFNIYVYKSPAAFDNYGQSDLNTIKDSVKKIISYSESAKMSEINAGISEINAKASEEASAANANAANLASVSAAEYASAAKNSATAADTSAANAAANASTAGAKATEAANSAASAASSASTATSKANAASTSAANAANSATEAESYAHGGTGARTNEEIDNAKYYYEQSKSISVGFSGALRPMGTVAFAQLPSLSAATEGDMYNISDQFTTNANFKEGNGLTIPAGANVYKTADGYWDILAGSPVAGVKGNAESSYRTGNVNITPADIGLGNVKNTSDYLPLSGGTMTGDILGSDGGHFNKDGNVFINGAGWLTDILSGINNSFGNYLPLSGGTVNGNITSNRLITNNSTGLTLRGNEYSVFLRNDGNTFYLLLTDQGNPDGTWNALRPFAVNLSTGAVSLGKVDGNIEAESLGLDIGDTDKPFYHIVATNFCVGNNHMLYNAGTTLVLGVSGAATVRSVNDINTFMPITASAFTVNSSRLIKDNIKPMTEDEAQKILDVDVIDFDYKAKYGGQKSQHGVIAEDINNIIPSAVYIPDDFNGSINESGTNIPSVDYSKFVPYLIKMVQIQQSEIDQLKAANNNEITEKQI